jgi:hypothetical protein
MHPLEIQAAIDLLKQNGFHVIRKEKVITLGATVTVDMLVFAAARYPPEQYIDRELAMYMAKELPKVWKKEQKTLSFEQQVEYCATVMVVKP